MRSEVIVSVQLNDNKRPLFANMQVVDQLDKRSISQSLYNKIGCGTRVDTDGWASYNVLNEKGLEHRRHIVGSPKNASKLLPWVHIVISNCKGILLGTHHGVSYVYLSGIYQSFVTVSIVDSGRIGCLTD